MPEWLARLARSGPRPWLLAVAAAAALQRLLLYLACRPVAYSDSASYRRAADAILDGWSRYDGTRTPGYPLFLAAAGPDERVYLAQLALGFLTTLLIFYLGWRISRRGWFAALAALAHSLSLQQLLFEANLLTETLTTFLLVALLAVLAWLLGQERARPAILLPVCLGAGLLGAAAVLTRPAFVFLPVWVPFFLLVAWRLRPGPRWAGAAALALAGLAVIAVWAGYIYRTYGFLSLTTMNGYHLVQHTGQYFELVPDEYAAVRDIYLQFRDLRVAETGAPSNAIWDAIPAIEKATGIGFYDLSRLLAKISVQLIRDHPWLYLRGVAEGWVWFWKAPVYWSQEAFRVEALGGFFGALIPAGRGLLILANLLFLLGSLALIVRRVRARMRMDPFLWLTLTVVWLASIVQALLDHGDNPRFSVPVQSLVVLLVLYWGWRWLAGLEAKVEKPAA